MQSLQGLDGLTVGWSANGGLLTQCSYIEFLKTGDLFSTHRTVRHTRDELCSTHIYVLEASMETQITLFEWSDITFLLLCFALLVCVLRVEKSSTF